jgi:hypothetical protein
MISSLEIKVEVSKDCLSGILTALGKIESKPEYAYDIGVNARLLFGMTTGYTVIVKTKSPYVIQTVITSIL